MDLDRSGPHEASQLLLSPELDPSQVVRILEPYGFKDCHKADANLQGMAGDPGSRQQLAVILQDLLAAVADTADPDQALNEWDRFLDVCGNRLQLFKYFAQVPHILHVVSTVFGNSPALSQVFIRDPLLVYWVNNEQVLRSRPTRLHLQTDLERTLDNLQARERKLDAIRRFFRREMLRIGVRDLVRVADVTESVDALSNLAEVVIQSVYTVILHDFHLRYGFPHTGFDRSYSAHGDFVVLAMGKLGGKELNYSSDVDLVYLCQSMDGQTKCPSGGESIANGMFFHLLAQEFTNALSVATTEGFLFRVDLRLRPEGAVGPMVTSVADAVRYYETRGREWERLAFLKARPIVGNLDLGRRFLRKLRPFIMGNSQQVPQVIVGTIHSLRAQIHTKIYRRGEEHRNVKLSPGGIRDIEWITQGLQLIHCQQYPRMLEKNTLKALRRLTSENILNSDQECRLRHAYVFFRDVEHKLQMEHDLQTHLLPSDPDDLRRCAIRMGYSRDPLGVYVDRFLSDYLEHLAQVQLLLQRIFPALET